MKIKNRPNRRKKIKFKRKWEKYYGFRCAYCGEDCSDNPTIDHLIPISKGGGNNLGNMVISCITCNQEKGDKIIDEFKPLILRPLGDPNVIHQTNYNNYVICSHFVM